MYQLLTVQVLRGYIGDRNSRPIWGGRQLFDVLGSGYQRPFELATLRLFHMYGVLSKCKKLRLQHVRQPASCCVGCCQLCTQSSMLNHLDAAGAELSPPNAELLTQQGGTLIFRGEQVLYSYKDRGILTYTPLNEVMQALQAHTGITFPALESQV